MQNMRNSIFKELREKYKDQSSFFLGSNKVMQSALGRTPDDEYRDDLHHLSMVL